MLARQYCFTLTLALAALATNGAGAQTLEQRLDGLVEAVEPRVIAWRRDIHANPELGFEEVRTSALVANHLEESRH